MKKNSIKAVIFDVGGVLAIGNLSKRGDATHSTKTHEEISKKLRVSIDQYFDAIDSIYAKSIEGKISEKKVVSVVSKNLKVPEKRLVNLFSKAYKDNFQQNKQLYNFAFRLKKKGYKIAILSDQWHLSKRPLILKKYSKKFDAVIISCDVGVRKPNPKIYRLLLKKLKLPAKNCLFIDNQEWNIKPAKKLGIKTILYKNNKQIFRELKKYLK